MRTTRRDPAVPPERLKPVGDRKTTGHTSNTRLDRVDTPERVAASATVEPARPPDPRVAPPAAASASRSALPPLSVTLRDHRDGLARVEVAGEVDLATAPWVRRALLDVIASAERPAAIQLDLSGVSFIDAQGIAMLEGAQRAADSAGVRLSVHKPGRTVLRLLEVFGLTDTFRIVA